MTSTFNLKINNIIRISSSACHSAFCDAIDLGDTQLACYRQATNHISADGRIETTLITPQGKQRQHLWFNDVDLRDPKLSRLPDGRILLIAYARHTANDNKTLYGQSIFWVSQDGSSWSSPRYFGPKNWWLWRLTWHKGVAYGLAYNREKERVDLYTGHPLRTMDCIKQGALSKQKEGYGYPNESDIWFDKNHHMHVLLRRDADSYSSLQGKSAFPYTKWQWNDLNKYVGGPKVIANPFNPKESWVCGRGILKNKLKTCLWSLTNENTQLVHQLTLPSAGDNSYPGMFFKNGCLNIVYYSSHIDNQSRVYLATLK
ncbi:hypothetical protein J3L16_06115 [Alteromonas sp. 5E99-2]|uniref:hypothetical protein n=1 Tax=Alteromonas sp. 5E99-2 TaxID=2817683 RepID=UPI001A990221|nr:hypothetical protein [Alteromonas sp. 5E99-2]MBO1255259.1 hypothetical protein [Alteromonas sp. 5E99-2]